MFAPHQALRNAERAQSEDRAEYDEGRNDAAWGIIEPVAP